MKKISIIIVLVMVLAAALTVVSACGDGHYDLVYAAWNLGTEAGNNIERQMIAAFEEKYNVKVKIEQNVILGSGWEDSIVRLASTNTMPDVYMLTNMSFGLEKHFLADISEFAKADLDWNDIPAPVEQGAHYKSGIYAIPFAMHMMGYIANEDLIGRYMPDVDLTEDFNYDQFFNIVQTMANFKQDHVIGLSHENTIFEWYPSSVNKNYGWFTWDGSEYHLDSPEFKDGIDKTAVIRSNGYSFEGLSTSDRENYFEGFDTYVQLWNQGKLALRWGYSYEIPNMIEESENAFDIRFMGVPGGRTPIVPDYLAISPTCKNMELAYKFAKWMSFGPDGIEARIEKNKDVPNSLPLTTREDLIDKYFQKFTSVAGLKEMWTSLDNGIVESVKVVPGYNRARWLALTGVYVNTEALDEDKNAKIGNLLDYCWTGALTYADYSASVNALANKEYKNACDKFEKDYE